MAIVSFNEIWDARRASDNYRKETTYTRVFRVVTDSTTDGPAFVGAAVGVPRLGDTYTTGTESDPLAYLLTIDVSPDQGSPNSWLIRCEYSTKFEIPEAGQPPGTGGGGGGGGGSGGEAGAEGSDPGNFNPDPTARPSVWRYSFSKGTKAVKVDLDDLPIVNSAGQAFVPAVEMQWSTPLIQVTKNYAVFDFAYLEQLSDTVNDTAWLSFSTGTVKLDGIEAHTSYEGGVGFWSVTWNFSVNYEGWNPTRILDQGFYERVDGKLKKITDSVGNELSSQTLLNGAGSRLPDGDDPVLLERRLYRWADFNTIDLT